MPESSGFNDMDTGFRRYDELTKVTLCANRSWMMFAQGQSERGTRFFRRRCSRASQQNAEKGSPVWVVHASAWTSSLGERCVLREAQGTRAAGKPLP